MFHHVSFGTRDAARAKAFYDPVLAVVGMRCLAVTDKAVGYGVNDYLFSLETPVDGRPATAGNGAHVAFVARDRAVVDEFYRVALEQGGTCDGKPGLRPEQSQSLRRLRPRPRRQQDRGRDLFEEVTSPAMPGWTG